MQTKKQTIHYLFTRICQELKKVKAKKIPPAGGIVRLGE